MNKLSQEVITTANINQLRQKLIDHGFKRIYENQSGLVVEETEAVKVLIKAPGTSRFFVEGKFPAIGNSVQIVATIAFFIIDVALSFGIYGLIGAILLGQVVAYYYYQPKIEGLKKKVARILLSE